MSDSISRQAAIGIVEFECGEWRGLASTIVKAIEQLPSAQPEIVRCEECKYHHQKNCPIEKYFSLDGFCSRGKRREVTT